MIKITKLTRIAYIYISVSVLRRPLNNTLSKLDINKSIIIKKNYPAV